MTNSQRRLLIISPWITRSVVDNQLVHNIEQLAKTADVTIFWGFGDNTKTDTRALNDLHAAALRSKRLAIVKVADTYAKVLVSDNYYIKTSFNWLSFRGDRSMKYHQEEGDLNDEVLADGAYDRYMTQNCGLALDVVATLPENYRHLVGARVTHTAAGTTAPASTQPTTNRAKKTASKLKKRTAPANALTKFSVGQTMSGVVTSLTNYGAFVDLGGIDGMIHKSRLGRRNVSYPSEVVTQGDIVNVIVVNVDHKKQQVDLALNPNSR